MRTHGEHADVPGGPVVDEPPAGDSTTYPEGRPSSAPGGRDAVRDPRWSPTSYELDDLAMVLLGAYAGVRGPVLEPTTEPPDARCPVAPHLEVPAEVARAAWAAGRLELLDEENTPYAVLHVVDRAETADGRWRLAGTVAALRSPARGSHPHLCCRAGGPPLGPMLLAVPVDRPFPAPVTAAVRAAAAALGARVRLFPLTGAGRPRGLDGAALVRICLALAGSLGADVVPLSVPLHDPPATDEAIVHSVVGSYGATHVVRPGAPGSERADTSGPVAVPLPPVALDMRTASWAPTTEVPFEARSPCSITEADDHLEAVLERGAVPQAELFDATTRRELERRRPGGRRGFAIFFTGLSGSGKSTAANAVLDAIMDRSGRTATLLDGDLVRRMLSSELTFSREHRELNVRRIGYVASHVTAHGGVVLCAPIAPYDRSRREVREMIESTGAGFILVHVATPLAVCEARDVKGLYARARAGTIPAFTGISDPYEVPDDADIVSDTSTEDLDALVERVLRVAVGRGWLELAQGR